MMQGGYLNASYMYVCIYVYMIIYVQLKNVVCNIDTLKLFSEHKRVLQ